MVRAFVLGGGFAVASSLMANGLAAVLGVTIAGPAIGKAAVFLVLFLGGVAAVFTIENITP